MKTNCSIIQDLLPLYKEEIVSPETKTLVEEHLQTCRSCQNELDEMTISVAIPMDINSYGLKKVKATLMKNKLTAVLFATMLAFICSIVIINVLTKPRPIPYSDTIVSITEQENGEILAHFSEKVSGFQIDQSLVENKKGAIYSVTAWRTLGSQLLNKQATKTIVLNPNDEPVTSVYYVSENQINDVLLFGEKMIENGGIVTLPRFFLTYYFLIAATLSAILFLFILVTRKTKKIQTVIRYLFFAPLSYVLATLCIKGVHFASLFAMQDLLLILLISVPIYVTCVLSFDYYRYFKQNRLSSSKQVI